MAQIRSVERARKAATENSEGGGADGDCEAFLGAFLVAAM